MTNKFVLDNSPAGKRPKWQPVVTPEKQGVLFDQLHWERDDRSLFEEEDHGRNTDAEIHP